MAGLILGMALMAFSLMSRAEDCAQNLGRLENLARGWRKGWGERGFLSHKPALTTETLMAALELGLLWWDLPMFFMRDLESAQVYNAELDSLARGIYFIGHEVTSIVDFLGLDSSPSNPRRNHGLQDIASAAFRSAARNGAYEFLNNGKVRYLPYKSLIRKIPVEHLYIAINPSHFGRRAYLALPGWVAPTERGVLKYDAEFVRRRAVRRAQKLREQLIRLGYKIEFTQDFAASLQLLSQHRRYGLASRYIKLVYFNAAQALHAQGRAFILEVVSPTGQRLAGALGYLFRKSASGDTVYVNENALKGDALSVKIDPIDLYRVLAVTLLEHFARDGITQLDVQMLTSFSKSLGGKLIPREEFLQSLAASSNLFNKSDDENR